jgi:hypothetical protein
MTGSVLRVPVTRSLMLERSLGASLWAAVVLSGLRFSGQGVVA